MYIDSQNPTRLVINESINKASLDALKTGLTYTNQQINWQYRKLKTGGGWFINKFGLEAYNERLEQLKAESKVCILTEEEDGSYSTYSGLAGYVSTKLNLPVVNNVVYPKPNPIPWDKKPFDPYPYQEAAYTKLLEARHAGVSMATGLGKTLALTYIVKLLGLKTVVMAPSGSIAEQIHRQFVECFGQKYVGAFFDGKKEPKKLIVVGTAQSFTRVKEGSPAWKALEGTQVFIADESHQCPASTLANVCFGLVAKAPYRFFFSATQMRNDGSGILLDGITGPIVFEMTVREGVDKKYLAKPLFHMFNVDGNGDFESQDANEMTRHHLFYNPKVLHKAAWVANQAVSAGMPTVILVEEFEQFTKLLPHLKHQVAFAHGGAKDETNRKKIPKEFWESDPNALVRDFNEGKIKLLVGTSCISTGTDIKPVKMLIYLQGGKSEVQVKQAVGRGTRITPTKDSCHVVDFHVDAPIVSRHASLRAEIYNDLYGPVVYSG